MIFRIFIFLLILPITLQAYPKFPRENWSISSKTTISDRSIKIEHIEDPSSDKPTDQNPMQRKERIMTKFQERITQQSKKA